MFTVANPQRQVEDQALRANVNNPGQYERDRKTYYRNQNKRAHDFFRKTQRFQNGLGNLQNQPDRNRVDSDHSQDFATADFGCQPTEKLWNLNDPPPGLVPARRNSALAPLVSGYSYGRSLCYLA